MEMPDEIFAWSDINRRLTQGDWWVGNPAHGRAVKYIRADKPIEASSEGEKQARIDELEEYICKLVWRVTDGRMSRGYDVEAVALEVEEICQELCEEAVKEARADDGWRPIDHPDIEQIKKDGTQILVPSQWSGMDADIAAYDSIGPLGVHWWSVKLEEPMNEPRHWMPIPKPPVQGKSDE